MFGRMENTNQAMELQITQEYTGQSRMLTYLGADVGGGPQDRHRRTTRRRLAPGRQRRRRHRAGPGRHARSSASPTSATPRTSPATTSAQANLFAFGRLAWDWTLGSEDIARDWVRMTWSNDARRRRHDRADDDGLLGGARELPDAARRRAPVPFQRPLRADAQRVVPARRLEPGLLQQGRQRRPRLRPLAHRQQPRRPVLPAAAGALREHRHDAREPADVVPPRAVGPDDEQRPARSGTSSSTATRWACST